MRRMARLDPGDLTMLIRSVALLLGVIVPLFLGDAARAATEDFGVWLQALRRDALADGVSKATVDAAALSWTSLSCTEAARPAAVPATLSWASTARTSTPGAAPQPALDAAAIPPPPLP